MCADQFREVRLPLPQISGICKSRFHPTDAVLACGSNGQVTILKAANGSVPFSDWRIERKFKGQNVKEIVSLEWNVSYSIVLITQSKHSIVLISRSINDFT